jgi:uncharacterized protein YdhG (YjbR/CyaY superfamily)
MAVSTVATIDDYIAQCPPDIQERLRLIRTTIAEAAPDAEETISYRMPTFRLHGILVHFAACARHIGFYPTPSAIIRFKKDLAGYANSKGAIRFSHDQPIPRDLIRAIVEYRVTENRRTAARKKA